MAKERILAHPPFFIVGSPRSGTTLLERLLNAHQNVFIPPETEFFRAVAGVTNDPAGLKSPGELKSLFEHYRSMRAYKLLRLPEGDDESILLTGAESFRDVLENLLRHLAGETGKNRFGEKTPLHVRYVKQIRECFPDSPIIAIMRDGRAVVSSRLKHPVWNHNIISAARAWKKDVSRIDRAVAALGPERFLVVRYEDLVDNSDEILDRVLSFLGEQRREPIGTNGSDKRFSEYYSQPWMRKSLGGVDQSRAEAWRTELSRSEVCLLNLLMCAQLRRWGYECRLCVVLGLWSTLFREIGRDVRRKVEFLKGRGLSQPRGSQRPS